MIRCQYFVLADEFRQALRGTFDIMGVMDRIHAPNLPGVHRRLAVIMFVVTDEEDDLGKRPFRFTISGPGGRQLMEQKGMIQLKPEGGSWLASARLVLQFEGFPLPEYGKYVFSLEVAGTIVGSHPMTVTPQPALPAA